MPIKSMTLRPFSFITLTRAFSSSLELLYGDYSLINFTGRHGMERIPVCQNIAMGSQSFGSKRGTSSHQHNPFFIIAEQNATESAGNCYGMALLYSGSFRCEVERDQFNMLRAAIGVQDEQFAYTLNSNKSFYAPEIAFCHSENGLATLSHRLHHLIQKNVCRGVHRDTRRPILINNWEATYFNFDHKKLLSMAEQAAQLGVEMLVLDDGWFGKRNDDMTGLGDWIVNETKLGCSLAELAEKINSFGMKFGLWIEPEMVSEDSDLYRAHPDWALRLPNRGFTRGRHQLVLDFSRPEVVTHVFNQIADILDTTNVEYIKMDMNRSITDVYSAIGRQNNGAILYNYTLGVYAFLEKLSSRYPHLLIEGCSGGGGRFDAGMLYYTPQIWCSDNTDAIERIQIQYGTSFCYPISTMGAHVSAVPNHQTGRSVSIETRGAVAMAGTFGYELDLSLLNDSEKETVKEQIETCKKYWNVINNGKYYRLNDVTTNPDFAAWQFVSDDYNEILLTAVTLNTHCNQAPMYIKLKGLQPNHTYILQATGKCYYGSALMNGGFPIERQPNEYNATPLYFIKEI